MELAVGAYAVYPGQGVVQLLAVQEKVVMGQRMTFFEMQIVGTDAKVLVPKKKVDSQLRELTTEGELPEVYDILREKEVCIDKQTWNRRYRGFMEKIKTGCLFEVAEVFRDLYRLSNQRALSFGERRMLDNVRTLVIREIAIINQRREDQVSRDLNKLMAA